NESAEIEQRPVRRAVTFAMLRLALQLLPELLFHFRADGLHLRRAEAGANHEIIRERFQLAQVDDGNGGCFLVLRRLDGNTHTWRQSVEFHRYKPCFKMYSSTRAETSP